MRRARGQRVLELGEREHRQPAGLHGDEARRSHDPAARGALALPPALSRHRVRCHHREPDHPRKRGLSAGLQLERLRTRRSKRRAHLEGDPPRAQRRPERRLGLRFAALRRNRHDGLRDRRDDRETPLVAATRRALRAVHRDRAGRRPWPGVREHPGLSTWGPWRDLRVVGRDGPDRLALPDGQAAVAASRRKWGRWRLEPHERRRARQRLRRHCEPWPLGWVEGVPERRRLPGPGALHRFARRARRRLGPAALVRPGNAPRRA